MTRRIVATALVLVALAAHPAVAAGPEEGDPDRVPAAQENVEARQRWWLERRLSPNGTYDPMAPLRAKQELAARARAAAPARTEDAGIWQWQWLGPGNVGGRVRALVINPSQPATMWAGTAGGGIWRTDNGGGVWSALTDFLPCLAVASLALDPTNPATLYAGTGELVGSNSTIAGAGVFKSTNSGLTWTQLPQMASHPYVSSLAHHPTQSGTVLAGTADGVFRTTDGGTTWISLFVPPDGPSDLRAVRYVGYDPNNPSVIAVGTRSNFYLSFDGGHNFTLETSGLPGKLPANPGDCVAAFARNYPGVIWVQPASTIPVPNDLSDWVYVSRDGGQTFRTLTATNADQWSNALWIAPNDSGLVVTGGFGDLRRYVAGIGATWISNGSAYPSGQSAHSDEHVVVAHPLFNGITNDTVYVANDGGVQKAADIRTVSQTSGWTNLAHNLGCSQFFKCAAAPDGSVIMGGMQDTGTAMLVTGQGAQDWTTPGGGDGYACAVNPSNTQIRYLSAQQLDLWRTIDGGSHWNPAVTGLGDRPTKTCAFFAPLEMSPFDPLTLLAGGQSLWQTTDGAASWHLLRGPVFGNPNINAIAFAKSSPLVIWLGYDNGLVSFTSDGGSTWTDRTTVFGRQVLSIAVNPAVWTEAFVILDQTANDNVLYTNTAGASWQVRNGSGTTGLPTIAASAVTYHPLQPNWVYVGTDIGVFASEDKGLTWSVTSTGPTNSGNDGPNNAEVDDLVWQGTTHLLAATHGRGLYRCAPLPIVYVDKTYVGPEDGSETMPFNTVAEAVAAYGPGAIVRIKSNTYPASPLVIDKRGWLESSNGASSIQ